MFRERSSFWLSSFLLGSSAFRVGAFSLYYRHTHTPRTKGNMSCKKSTSGTPKGLPCLPMQTPIHWTLKVVEVQLWKHSTPILSPASSCLLQAHFSRLACSCSFMLPCVLHQWNQHNKVGQFQVSFLTLDTVESRGKCNHALLFADCFQQ